MGPAVAHLRRHVQGLQGRRRECARRLYKEEGDSVALVSLVPRLGEGPLARAPRRLSPRRAAPRARRSPPIPLRRRQTHYRRCSKHDASAPSSVAACGARRTRALFIAPRAPRAPCAARLGAAVLQLRRARLRELLRGRDIRFQLGRLRAGDGGDGHGLLPLGLAGRGRRRLPERQRAGGRLLRDGALRRGQWLARALCRQLPRRAGRLGAGGAAKRRQRCRQRQRVGQMRGGKHLRRRARVGRGRRHRRRGAAAGGGDCAHRGRARAAAK